MQVQYLEDERPRGAICFFGGYMGVFLTKSVVFTTRVLCSGKLLLDREGVIFVQEMYNVRYQ